MQKIEQYRAGRNFIRLGDIVKGKLPGKSAFLGKVTEIQADDDGEVTGVFVTIIAKINGDPHGHMGKWRCLTPDQIERVAQTGPLATAARTVAR
mgnify:FL=1